MWDGTLRTVAVGEILCIGQRLKVKSMKYERKEKERERKKLIVAEGQHGFYTILMHPETSHYFSKKPKHF